MDDFPDEVRGRIKAELVPGERLIWAARATPRPFRFGPGYRAAALVATGSFGLSAGLSGLYVGVFGALFSRIEGTGFLGVVAGIIGTIVAIGIIVGIFQ